MILIGDIRNLTGDNDYYVCSLINNKNYDFDCYLKSLAPPWYLKRDFESGTISKEELLNKYRKYLLNLKDPDFPDSIMLLERLSLIINKTIIIVDASEYSRSLRKVIYEVSVNQFNINLINPKFDEKSK